MRSCLAVLFLVACNTTPADESSFVTTYGAAFCEHHSACNSGLACSPAITDMTSCAYDAQAATECLHGSWSCNTEYAGYEFAEPPSACGRVWDCSVARR